MPVKYEGHDGKDDEQPEESPPIAKAMLTPVGFGSILGITPREQRVVARRTKKAPAISRQSPERAQ